jgi:preprotein translocase subunit SecB
MSTSPLQLKSCYFTSINLSTEPAHADWNNENVQVEISVDCKPREGDPLQWFIFLKVAINPKGEGKSPFKGNIGAMGVFNVASTWTPENRERLVYVNGSGILYTSVREMVSILAGRTLYGPLWLPTLSFYEKFMAEEANKAKLQSPAEAPPPPPSPQPA